MDGDDKIKRLPVRFKTANDEGRSLKVVDSFDAGCDHRMPVTYKIRPGEAEVECGRCGARLDPVWVLTQLANRESRYVYNRERYNDEMRRLAERSKTACEHCGKMTRISRSKPRRSA